MLLNQPAISIIICSIFAILSGPNPNKLNTPVLANLVKPSQLPPPRLTDTDRVQVGIFLIPWEQHGGEWQQKVQVRLVIKYILKLKIRKMLLPILSGSSIILGIYLIVAYFFSNESALVKKEATYHLGCYDSGNPHDHSSLITQRVADIQSKFRQSTKLNMFNSKALRPGFEKDVQKVARSFQNFLDNFYKSKGAVDYNINYYNSLRLAKLDFDKCSGLKYFDENDCVRGWQQYKKSTAQIDQMKKTLNDLIGIKQTNQIALLNIALKKPNVNEEEVMRKFKVKIQQIKRQIDQSDENLVQIRTNKNKIKVDLSSIDEDIDQLKGILQQCVNNQELIIYCNKISKEVRRIEEAAPKIAKKQLENRLAKKLVIIKGLEESIKKADKADLSKLQRELNHQNNELKLLQFQIQNFQTKEESKCAMCSEERIAELRANISNLEAKKAELQRNWVRLQNEIISIQVKIGELKKSLELVQKQKQSFVISELCMDEQCKSDQTKEMEGKQRLLNELKKQIIDKQVEINLLQSSYTTKRDKMKQYLDGIDKITDCVRKKEYWTELKKRQPTESKVDASMIEAKRSIVQQLGDFQL